MKFQPRTQDDLAPATPIARWDANLAALMVLRQMSEQGRAVATVTEQQTLARWGGWGAQGLWQILDDGHPEHSARRGQLREMLGEEGFAAARRTTMNAHYTDASYVDQVWQAVQRLGFHKGRVLEPGCGAGTFIGMAPDGAQLTGVELDPTTAAVAQALYPGATIRGESFARTRYPAGHFDAVVGNVPFSDVVLHDPLHNHAGHAMHNHFIVKSLALTRPGGVVALLTSRYTLDAANPAARRDMQQHADLIAAVRLPTGAHTRAAGTEAITDLLIFRRREPGQEPAPFDWETTAQVTLAGPNGPEQVRVNSRYVVDADAGTLSPTVLGTPTVRVGMYGVAGLEIDPNPAGPVADQLAAALRVAVDEAIATGHGFTTVDRGLEVDAVPAGPDEREGHITAHADGRFTMVAVGLHEPLPVPATQRRETVELLQLRDHAVRVLNMEAASLDDTDELVSARRELAEGWQGYVSRYGPLNRCKIGVGRRTAADGTITEYETRTYAPAVTRVTRHDPFGPLITALELYDENTGTAAPAGLLRERQVQPRTPTTHVDTIDDAVTVSLDQTGGIDLPLIADLRSLTPEAALVELGDRVFPDPATVSGGNAATQWRYLTRAEYLSGDVRAKLDDALTAAQTSPHLERNVNELRAVLPPDLGPGDMSAAFGAVWIPASDITQFMRDVLGDRSVTVSYAAGTWIFDNPNRWSTAAVSDYGTERRSAPEIIKDLCEQRPVIVTDTIDVDGKDRRVANPVETDAAQEKAHQLTERLNSWLWEDPDRAERLITDYNRRFNSHVLRDYSVEGAHLTLPGLSDGWEPQDHQRAAVARMLAEPSVGLFHAVGAGKTGEMVMGMTELRRLGLVTKPAMVVPNHMLQQVAREWLQLYPQARVLTLSAGDISRADRQRFLARVAANDWDGIIFTQTAFEKVPLSAAARSGYERETARRHLREVQEMIESGSGAVVPKLKRVERKLLAEQERLADHLANHDEGITFEQTGIDYLVVDEIHLYKNLRTISSIPGAQIDGSQRATDLESKLHYLRSRNGNRVMCGATATPIANSVTELYVMQRYHNPEGLDAAGITSFDRWAATFGEVVTALEMNVTGNQFKLKSRFAKFRNTPELVAMLHTYGDIKTADDLHLPVPQVAVNSAGDRGPQVLTVPRSPELADYITDLDGRVTRIQARQVNPTDDNMLKVSSDGRKAALDLRLVDPELTEVSTPQKVEFAAHKIAQVWAEHSDTIYLDADGQPSPTPGALQIVFCDQSTPTTDGRWNVYDALRDALYERGLPAGSVRFIHEANSPDDKARLFTECRTGRVAVLIGSTEKMGVGTNIQDRAVHLLDMDAPWRPADLEQRHGRVVRRGNQNAEVELTQLVTEGSFDSYMWQTLERKSRFINQVMHGQLDGREMEDVAADTLTFAQFKAIATGNPLVLEETEARTTLGRLRRLETAHERNQQQLRRRVDQLASRLASGQLRITALEQAVTRTQPTTGDAFTMTVNRRTYTRRAEAAVALADAIASAQWGVTATIAHCGGHDLTFTQAGADSALGIADTELTISAHPAAETSPLGRITRIENLISGIPGSLERSRRSLQEDTINLDRAQASIGQPFQHADALNQCARQHAIIAAKLAAHLGQNTINDASADTQLGNIRHQITALNQPGATMVPPAPTSPGEADQITPEIT